MHNLIFKFLLGFSLLALGLKVIFVKKFVARGGMIDFTNPWLHWTVSIGLILMGTTLLYTLIRK